MSVMEPRSALAMSVMESRARALLLLATFCFCIDAAPAILIAKTESK
jgi:hypothetical protein